jgi:4'-phosphopantetheinyl transferase EntD
MLPAALLLAAITAAGGHAEEKLSAARAAKAKAEFAQALSLAREALRPVRPRRRRPGPSPARWRR